VNGQVHFELGFLLNNTHIMATYRKLHTSFWTDPFVEELSQEQKLFYLYLISNTKTTQSGIYEITKKYIAYETGFSIKEVTELLNYFVENKKVLYSELTNEIAITNWVKFNLSTSHTVLKCVLEDLKNVKDNSLVKLLYDKDYIDILLSVPDYINKKGENVSGIYTPLIEYLLGIHTPLIEYIEDIDTALQQAQTQAQTKAEADVQAYAQAYAKVQSQAQTDDTFDLNSDSNNSSPLGGDEYTNFQTLLEDQLKEK